MTIKYLQSIILKNRNIATSVMMICSIFLLANSEINAQIDNVNMQNGSITTSYANFYDSGGENSEYQHNENLTLTIYPENQGEKICVTFHEFLTQSGSDADVLYVYNGNSTSAPLIAELNGNNYGTIPSSAEDGSLTFQFVSNGSNNEFGWAANITTDLTPEDITMIGDATWYVSSGRFLDNGGENGNYSDNKNVSVTLMPENSADKVSVTFQEFYTQEGTNADVLYVYDGNNTSAPLIARLSNRNYGTITSTSEDGSLTFQFISNSNNNEFGWNAAITMNEKPRDISMLASGTYIISEGRFYDNGGPQRDYEHNREETVTLIPENTGDLLSVNFQECDISDGDVLYAFDGNNSSAPLIASISGSNYGTVTSSASDGSLTFKFVSNGAYNSSGWYASISTYPATEEVTMLANGTFTIDRTGRFYDNGGPSNDYGHNQNVVTTLKPVNSSDKLSVTFHNFYTRQGSDILSIFDGNNTDAPLIGSYSGDLNVFTVTSTAVDGSLTFQFTSNDSNKEFGWNASITTTDNIPSHNMTVNETIMIPSGESAFFYDSGGPDGNYSNNENTVVTLEPENSNDKISASFNYFGTYNQSDYLEIYDGNTVTAPLLATLSSNAGYGTINATSSNSSGALTFKFVSGNTSNWGGWAATISTNTSPQNISQPGEYALPANKRVFFFDAGGPGGNYINNMNNITTIMPENSGDKISVSFNYFGTYNQSDYLEIYDGNSVTAPLLATLSSNGGYGTIKATSSNSSGALTFKFVSGSTSNWGGWAATLSTNSSPKNISQPGEYILPANSTGFFYDAGGPGGNYINNMNNITTIMPENSNDKISVSFNYFGTYNQSDYLEIYDGNTVTAPLLAKLSSNAGYGTINATSSNSSGALTFKFVSGSTSNWNGWAATISANALPENISQPGEYTISSNITGFFYDAGGPGGNYINNMNNVTTIMPENSNNKISVSFNNFGTYNDSDYLEIYDGSTITSPLIGSFSQSINPGTITATEQNISGALTFRFISGSTSKWLGWAAIVSSIDQPTGTDENDSNIVTKHILGQIYPNPIDDNAMIEYNLPAKSQVNLSFYDNLGRHIYTLVDEEKPAGNYSVSIDVSDWKSGIYYYQLSSGNVIQVSKMIVR